MERLTYRDKDGFPMMKKRGGFKQGGVERLAAYEDTHMMPSDVTSMRMDMAIIAALFNGVDVDRMKELAEADKDGRLVVLPCEVGGTLWVTGRDNVPREMELEDPDIRAVCTDEDNLCMSTCNRKPDGFCAYRLRNDGADIGKTVFLTREDAVAEQRSYKVQRLRERIEKDD